MDIPQNLELVTRGRYLQPSEKNPADSPTVDIEQPSLSFPSRRVRAGRDAGWIVKNAKATKIKVDDKTSSSSDGISEISDAEVNGNSFDWFKTFPVEPVVAEVKAEEKNLQRDWYITEQGAKDAPRTAATGRPDIEGAKFPPQKNQKGQQHGEDHKRKSFHVAELIPKRPPSLYPLSRPYGSFPSHRSSDTLLDCRLRSTHYTISQDHTSGQEAHDDSLLASFGKRRRTDKPSVLSNGGRLLQRSANLLPSLANGDDAVAQNKGSGMQKMSQDDLDFLSNWKSISSKMPEDVSERVQERGRQALSYLRRRERSRRLQPYLPRQDQQHQPPQAYISSVVNTNDPDDDVSRDRLRRGLHPLDPSPPPEVPPSIVRPKIRLTSGNAALVADRPDSVVYPRITRTTTRHSSSVNGFAAEEQ